MLCASVFFENTNMGASVGLQCMQLELFPEVALSHLDNLVNKYSVYLDHAECLHR